MTNEEIIEKIRTGIKTFQDFYNLVISHIQKED